MKAAVLVACALLAASAHAGILQPGALDQPPQSEPGPLSGGKDGARYLGPGFHTYLPRGWTVTLDELPKERRGESGVARPPTASPDAEIDAMFRFEPYPPEPGAPATLSKYEEFVRRTLATGAPVAVMPLVKNTDGFKPRAGNVDGLTFWFTRPAQDGQAARRFFVHALPRADGRLQTVVCSHEGPGERGLTAAFARVGHDLATVWPDQGGVYRREDVGVALDCPPEWRPFRLMHCGQFWMQTEEEQSRGLMPVNAFARTDPASGAAPPDAMYVSLSVVREFDGDMSKVLYADQSSLFEFADGGAGRVNDSGDGIIVVRIAGTRLVQAQASRIPPQERAGVLALIRGLRLETPRVETSTPDSKTVTAQGVSITYPGDWRLARPMGRLLAGSLAPMPPIAPRREHFPSLSFSIERLDDLLAERRRTREAPPYDINGKVPTIMHDDRPFQTDSGWEGHQWTTTTDVENKRGRVIIRNVWYILPMPDGVSAVCLGGTTTTTDRRPLQSAWRRIAESVERCTGAPRTSAPAPKQS